MSGTAGNRISTASLWDFGGGKLSCGVPRTFPPEFLAKIGIVVEEADETVFWLEMLTEAGLVRGELLGDIISEANQLVASPLPSSL